MGQLRKDFVREARKVNSHFERWVKSSLRPIMNILDGIADPRARMPAIPSNQNLTDLTQAIAALPVAKATKYSKALTWLNGRVVGLSGMRTDALPGIGQTTGGYEPGKEVRYPDKDRRWHNFLLQEKGNSCGPTSTRTILLAHTIHPMPSEQNIRDHIGLIMHGMTHTGVESSGHNWEDTGMGIQPTVDVLKYYGIRDARSITSPQERRAELAKCTKNNPGLIGWLWQPPPNGGHLTTCVGLTKAGDELIILDPWTQLGYVPAAHPWNYYPTGGGHGKMADVVVTHPR